MKCGESLCFIDVTECLCRGPRRLVYSQRILQFVSNMLLLGVDWMCLSWDCGVLGDLKVMLLEYFLGSEISLSGLPLPV